MNYKKTQEMVNGLLRTVCEAYKKIDSLSSKPIISGDSFRLTTSKYDPSISGGIEIIIRSTFHPSNYNLAVNLEKANLTEIDHDAKGYTNALVKEMTAWHTKFKNLNDALEQTKSTEVTKESLAIVRELAQESEYKISPKKLYDDLEKAAKVFEGLKGSDYYSGLAKDLKSKLKSLKKIKNIKEFKGKLSDLDLSTLALFLSYQNKK